MPLNVSKALARAVYPIFCMPSLELLLSFLARMLQPIRAELLKTLGVISKMAFFLLNVPSQEVS